MSRGDQSLGADEAGCQLFLISPPVLEPASFAHDLDEALAEGGIAGFLLRGQAAGHNAAWAAPLQEACRARATAFLIEDDPALALELGADGLHLTATAMVQAGRRALGDGRILGAACRASRHHAMSAGEHGADYVAFGDVEREPDQVLLELIEWWSGLFVLPCLALGAIGPGNCTELVDAGADFLGVSDAIWQHADGARAGVRAMQRAIARA